MWLTLKWKWWGRGTLLGAPIYPHGLLASISDLIQSFQWLKGEQARLSSHPGPQLTKVWHTQYQPFDENLKDYNFEQNLFGPDWKHFYFLFCLWNCKGWELELEDCRKWAERRPTIVISPTTKMHSALNTHNQFSWFCSVRVIILKALCTIYTFWFIGLSF